MLQKYLDRIKKENRQDNTPLCDPDGRAMDIGRKRGSEKWIPFASCCTTGQFMRLREGFKRHCGPTAAVNIVRMLENRAADGSAGGGRPVNAHRLTAQELFLLCADIGSRMHIYWNGDFLGHFGGTFNFLMPWFLRRCLRASGFEDRVSVKFHPWITPDAVEKALNDGAIVYLEVYLHPKYKDHHMLCYACRRENGKRLFLLSDGWSPVPVYVGEEELGHGHFMTIRPIDDLI